MLGDAVRAWLVRLRVSQVYWRSHSAYGLLLAALTEAPGITSFS